MAQIAVTGTLEVSIDGVIINAMSEVTIEDGESENEGIVGADLRVHGYAKNGKVPSISGTMTLAPGQDIGAIKRATGVTPIVRFGVNQGFVLRDAWFAGPGTFKTGKHEFEYRFEGVAGEWLN